MTIVQRNNNGAPILLERTNRTESRHSLASKHGSMDDLITNAETDASQHARKSDSFGLLYLTQTRKPASTPGDLGIALSKDTLRFGLGSRLAVVNEVLIDEFSITNQKGKAVYVCLGHEEETSTYQLMFRQDGLKYEGRKQRAFKIERGKTVFISATLTLKCTTKVEMVVPVFVSMQAQATGVGPHININILAVSELSTFLDYDEIEFSGPQLGEGAFGTVFQGRYRGQDVAIKVANTNVVNDSNIEEFEREFSTLYNLRSPYIVQFIGGVTDMRNLCLVFEYIALGSLNDRLNDERDGKIKEKMSPLLRMTIAIHCAQGMQFLHKSGIIHRDLKPGNVMLVSLQTNSQVTCKIADFGTARQQYGESTQKHTKAVGTIFFMAPELLKGNEARNASEASDVYAYGMLLWELFTGQVAFSGISPFDAGRQVLDGKRPQLEDVTNAVVRGLIGRCWDQETFRRPLFENIVTILTDPRTRL